MAESTGTVRDTDDAQRRDDPAFDDLLEHIRSSRGFDFTGYKHASLHRRIDKRMGELGIDGYDAYKDHLEVNPDEYAELFNTILINVTEFFRDPEAWASLRERVIPRILDNREPSRQPIRVWSAACSSGQETYSLAIVLAEALGIDEFVARVKIYGTDLDEEDLARARHAVYTADDVENVPEDLLGRYFEHRDDGRYRFRSDLRRSVIFGVHDIVQDAPISNLDLLSCRNTLMYFNGDLQSRVLERFHFALRPDGFLFLGRAETLLTYSDLYEPVDLGNRLFAKAVAGQERPRRLADRPEAGEGRTRDPAILAAAFDRGPIAQVVIDADGYLVEANTPALATFELRPGDLGRPVRDLELSYRPVELRSLIEQARRDERTVSVSGVSMGSEDDGDQRFLDVDVTPLRDPGDSGPRGTSITFTDVTARRRLEHEHARTRRELERTYEDLQSTHDDLETTNEELQSTIEELETTNEELRSSNEELEMMNEELQSTNDELEVINRELQYRTEEADELNAYLRSILRGIRGAVVVVDRDGVIRIWSPKARDLWGLSEDEAVGWPFTDLEIGLPVAELRDAVESCIEERSEYQLDELSVHDRRGRHLTCAVRTTPLVRGDDRVEGAILLMEITDGTDRHPEE